MHPLCLKKFQQKTEFQSTVQLNDAENPMLLAKEREKEKVDQPK